MPFGQLLTGSAADLVRRYFVTEELRMLAAPWTLHLGLIPEDPSSALWTVFALGAMAGGNPAPVGGSGRLAEALTALVTERGGEVICDTVVDQILVDDRRAVGVRTADGGTVTASEAVIASVTPDQLDGRLLGDAAGVPAGVRSQAAGYRFKRGCFQINLALSARPGFIDSRLDAGGVLNLGRGLDELLVSVRQAEAGLLPEHPSISGTSRPPSIRPEPPSARRLSGCRFSTPRTPPPPTRPTRSASIRAGPPRRPRRSPTGWSPKRNNTFPGAPSPAPSSPGRLPSRGDAARGSSGSRRPDGGAGDRGRRSDRLV